ncbi:MAG: hypothetical protein DRP45_09275 [Candidatus Zixiibacteriota bacterium]|nr:MAG: hypothetical protein DRP45_09275 [candidate division Zixibacteria bacterium]
MPEPLAICIETIQDRSSHSKYTRCVAIPGRQPGLRLDEEGKIQWQCDDSVAAELWVSADDKLILYRPEGATNLTLSRMGRTLNVPSGKPVVVLDKDEIHVGEAGCRIHIHGKAPSVAAPSLYSPTQRTLGTLGKAVATAAIIGGMVTAGCSDIEVREMPPVVVLPDEPKKPETDPPPEKPDESPKELPIEVHEDPPDIVPDVSE